MRQKTMAETTQEIKNHVRQEMSGKVIGLAISGNFLYGFPSQNSDIDNYRGVYITATDAILGSLSNHPFMLFENFKLEFGGNDIVLTGLQNTIYSLINGDCNTFEHIFAPQIEQTEEFAELRDIATSLIAKDGLYNSYKGFAKSNMPDQNDDQKKVKKYLYVIRRLLSGIHVLETGKIESNLQKLNNNIESGEIVDNLISLKMSNDEKPELLTKDISEPNIIALIQNLYEDLNIAYENSDLPEEPTKETLDKTSEWLIKIRRAN